MISYHNNAVSFGTLGLLVALASYLLRYARRLKAPMINNPRPLEITSLPAKQRFLTDCQKLLQEGFAQSRNAFQIFTHLGPVYVLASKYSEQIKNDQRFRVKEFNELEFWADIPGFGVMKEITHKDQILQSFVRTKLTLSLAKNTKQISDKIQRALDRVWTDNQEWHEVRLHPSMISMLAETSCGIFFGPDISRDKDWLRITVSYTSTFVKAALQLHLWPRFLVPVVHWFLPECRQTRKELREAREIFQDLLDARARNVDAVKADTGGSADLLTFLDETTKGIPYDATTFHLAMGVTAIHSTSDFLSKVIYNLCQHQDLLEPLRSEVSTMLKETGWSKSGLDSLKLMDSVMKETIRLSPFSHVSMRRVVTEDITLPGPVELPKGAAVVVSATNAMWDEEIFPDPLTFDGYRFVKLAQSSKQWEKTSPFVAINPENLGFGLGKDACPGRFLVSTEVKITLCHILMQYDLKLAPGRRPSTIRMGLNMLVDPGTILVRKNAIAI